MGLAAVVWSETEEVEMTIERAAWTADATVLVRLYPGDGSADIGSVVWTEGVYMGDLTQAEEDRAIEAAWDKRSQQ